MLFRLFYLDLKSAIADDISRHVLSHIPSHWSLSISNYKFTVHIKTMAVFLSAAFSSFKIAKYVFHKRFKN